MSQNSSDFFKSIAKEQAKQEEQKKQNKNSFVVADRHPWTGFSENENSKIIRMLSPVIVANESDYNILMPNGKLLNNEFSTKMVLMCEIYGDNHKRFYTFVPDREDQPDHFYYRLLDLVLKKAWYNDADGSRKSTLVNLKRCPALVDRFNTNGRNINISSNQFDKGWTFTSKIFANVIDRSRISDHRENKKTFLLSEYVSFDEKDNAYFNWGIKSFSSYAKFRDLQASYGALNSFDTLITKTGIKENAYIIKNASKFKSSGLVEEIPEDLLDIINTQESLTEEELSWKQADIKNITKPTGYYKWFSHIKGILLSVDKEFNTHFHDEIEVKAAKEKEEFDRLAKEQEVSNSVSGVDLNTEKEKVNEDKENVTSIPEAPRRRSSIAVEEPKDISVETLKNLGFNGLEYATDEVLAMITEIDSNGVIYWNENTELCLNVECNQDSPNVSSVKGCIKCGTKF